MFTVTDGLVLREVMYRDSDKMLTILTKERGKISASCQGARSRQSTMRAGTQLLSYSCFTLYESKGRFSVNAAEPIELFLGLRADILSLSLASYMAEVLDAVADEEVPVADLLATGLNCLYALSVRKKPRALIKATFEFRIMMYSGYSPDVSECEICGESEPEEPVFNLKTGRAVCFACKKTETSPGMKGTDTVPLCAQSLLAIRYILAAQSKKLLSFSMDEEPLANLAAAAERYLLCHLDRKFPTLEFYKAL